MTSVSKYTTNMHATLAEKNSTIKCWETKQCNGNSEKVSIRRCFQVILKQKRARLPNALGIAPVTSEPLLPIMKL